VKEPPPIALKGEGGPEVGRAPDGAVVSKDSDLLEPIRIVQKELGLSVGLLNPGKKKSLALIPHVDFIKEVRRGVWTASQFPDELEDANGKFKKPASW